MTSPISNQDEILMTAIFSMDVYNRDGDSAHNDSYIFKYVDPTKYDALGSADLLEWDYNSNTLFGAAEYSWNGQTFIAYRGTVFNAFWSEAWNGYGVGAGSPYGAQAREAIEFYQQVVNGLNPAPSGYASTGVVVTGHSLGGGLAGFIGDLYSLQGEVFDNMPFEAAASGAYGVSTGITALRGRHIKSLNASTLRLNAIPAGRASPRRPTCCAVDLMGASFSAAARPSRARLSARALRGRHIESPKASTLRLNAIPAAIT